MKRTSRRIAAIGPATALVLGIVVSAVLPGCRDSSSSPPPTVVPGVDVGPGFPSGTVLVVTSEATPETLSVLSLDEDTGLLGVVGGPLDIAAPVGDAETLALDAGSRLIYVASDIDGTVAVVMMDMAGTLMPIAGSPFPLEAPEPTVVHLNLASDVAYVGYRHQGFISRYPIDPGTGALGAPLATVPIGGTFIETMRGLGDLLYVICSTTSNILAFRMEPDGSLTDLGVDVATDFRPDYIDFIGDGVSGTNRLYVSTTAGTIEAYDIDLGSGALAPLPGAPYDFPDLSTFELLRATPDGNFIAVGAENPPAVGLLAVNGDGSLSPLGYQVMSIGNGGGPEGIVWSPNGQFLFVANHIVGGIFVYERVGSELLPGVVPRYLLPGLPIDLQVSAVTVSP